MNDIGKWTPLIAFAIYFMIAMARRVGKDRIPERWRWLRPVIMASLAEAGEVLLLGASVDDALLQAAYIAVGAMGIHGLAKEAGPNKPSKEEWPDE